MSNHNHNNNEENEDNNFDGKIMLRLFRTFV